MPSQGATRIDRDIRAIAPDKISPIELRPFDSRWAAELCGWISGDEELRMMAPGTAPPLTRDRVLGWIKPEGFAATGWLAGQTVPVAYGEVNPMARRKGHFWLGHVLVRPALRGRGYGLELVRGLLNHAFEQMHARQVALIVFPENTAAIECYLRAGFRAVGEEEHRFRADGPTEKLLRLEITHARVAV